MPLRAEPGRSSRYAAPPDVGVVSPSCSSALATTEGSKRMRFLGALPSLPSLPLGDEAAVCPFKVLPFEST